MGEKRWKGKGRLEAGDRPRRSVLVALVLACLTLITLDARGGSDSSVEPARRAVGEAFGPVERTTAAFVRPFTAVPSYFRSKGDLREDINRLETENAELRRQVDSGESEWTGRVDFRHEVLPLIVEVQSERYHSALVDRLADRRRLAALRAAGFVVVEVSDPQVWSRPWEVIDAVRRGLLEAQARRPLLLGDRQGSA